MLVNVLMLLILKIKSRASKSYVTLDGTCAMFYLSLGRDLINRSNDLLARGHDLFSRSLDLLTRGHVISSRSHNILSSKSWERMEKS